MSYCDLKRLLDITASAIGLVVLSPLMAAIALAVRIRLGSPVLFRQQRPGRNGEPFTLLKFRTMSNGSGPDASRLSGFGVWLRSSSLDELPELWNVLRGEMSLVGPRPLLMEYLPLYSSEQRRRHDVRPGITGLAQVSGRNLVSWEERFELDVRYVETLSARADLAIMWRTVAEVLKRSGVSSGSHVTVEPFRGVESASAPGAAHFTVGS